MINKDEAFGLPPGSVRATVFILLILAVIYYAFWQVDLRAVIADLAKIAMGFYFGAKVTEKPKTPEVP